MNAAAASRAAIEPYTTPANLRLRREVLLWAVLAFPVGIVLQVLGQAIPGAETIFNVLTVVATFGTWGYILVSALRQWSRILARSAPAPIVVPPYEAVCAACRGAVELSPAASPPRCPRCGTVAGARELADAWRRAAQRVRSAEASLGAAERASYLSILSLSFASPALVPQLAGLPRAARRQAVDAAVREAARATGGSLIADDLRVVPTWLNQHWPGSVPFQAGSFVSRAWTLSLSYGGAPGLVSVLDSAAVKGAPARASIELYLAHPGAPGDPALPVDLPPFSGFRMTLYEQGVHCVCDDDDPALLAPPVIGGLFEAAHRAVLAHRAADPSAYLASR